MSECPHGMPWPEGRAVPDGAPHSECMKQLTPEEKRERADAFYRAMDRIRVQQINTDPSAYRKGGA